MGFITDYATKGATSGWRDAREQDRPKPGGSYGRSSLSSAAAVGRLLEALRSSAPGMWSDNKLEQANHWHGINYIAGHRLGEQMSQAEFQVYHNDPKHPDGKREVTERDPPQGEHRLRNNIRPWDLVRLLQRPNKDDAFGDLMYMWMTHLTQTGLSLTWMVPNRVGTPFELYPIHPALAIPQAALSEEYPEGYYRIMPVYPYGPFSSAPTPHSAAGAPIGAQWMMRFKYHHPLLRYEGYSPYTGMRLHIDEVEMMDRSRFYSMKRSINPSAVLNFDEMEGMQPWVRAEIERVQAEWENNFQGSENHGKLIVGTPGGKLEQWGTRPIDMEYTEGWNQLVSFVMAGFGITKPAAGMIEDSSYSTLFATLKQLHLLTLEPLANRIAGRITRQLAPFFGDDLIVEIRCKRIDDHDVKRSDVQTMAQYGVMTKGEMRQAFGYPLTGAKWEEEIVGQQQQQPGMPGAEGGGMPGMEGAAGAPGQEGSADPLNPGIEDALSWQQGQEGQQGEAAAPQDPLNPSMQAALGGKQPTPPEAGGADEQESERPKTGRLGAGALGPRMKKLRAGSLRSKSLYEQVREVIHETNGRA